MMNFVEVKLTPVEQKQWTNTKAMFMWQAPGFAHILITMLNPRQDEHMLYWTRDIPTMATDGEIIMANPEFFFGLDINVRVAGLAHEVIHAILDHFGAALYCRQRGVVTLSGGKTLPYDDDWSNYAMDYIVNDFVKQSRIGRLGDTWLWDPQIGTQDDTWPVVYSRIYQPNKKPPGCGSPYGSGGGPDSKNGQGRFDHHMEPGQGRGQQSPSQAAQDRKAKQEAWNNAVVAAAAITREAQGQGIDTLNQSKFFDKLLTPQVSWTDHIFGYFSRSVGGGGYDFRRPDRRLIVRGIYAPARSGHGCDTVAVFMDSSGSIYRVKNLIDRFFAELQGIFTELRPRRIIVIWCDSKIKRVDIIESQDDLDECRYKGATGGGGTSFVPPFKWLEKNGYADRIDAAVYLTDLAGTFPSEEPDYPVIWCSIDKDEKPPWGECIYIPDDGTA
jgi:predicted metal-dependent peptidase